MASGDTGAGGNPNSNAGANLFGDFFAEQLLSLFSPQTREQSQQFSSQPASNNIQSSEQAATNAARQQLNLTGEAARNTAALNEQIAQSSSQRAIQQARELKNLQSSGSSSESFGLGAAPPTGYSMDYLGNQRMNPGAIANWQFRQGIVLNDQVRQAQKMQDIQTNAQKELTNNNFRNQVDLFNRQSIIDAQNKANDFIRQRDLVNAQLAGQQKVASIAAQGNILGSLFGSVGAGSPNYRYWN